MPRLYRDQLTQLFADNELPAYKLTYLNKLMSYGVGPPIADVYAGRPRYEPDEALAWLRARLKAQKLAATERAEFNRRFHQKQVAKLERAGAKRKALVG